MVGPTLVLWDIDGTLISDPRGMRLYFEDAAEALLDRTGIAPPERPNGSTDFLVLAKLLVREGFTPEQAQLLTPSALRELERLTTPRELIVADCDELPGARAAVDAVGATGA
ncbi:MAG: hypothetical protein QOE60_1076, partial [Thermoleophilaceae bacterium]|nr:hypothetical protein [Thermoleophilaceae bacterium]